MVAISGKTFKLNWKLNSISSNIIIHGRKLERTWTLLSADAHPGTTTLRLKHDPRLMNWQVGDVLGIAKTTGICSLFQVSMQLK